TDLAPMVNDLERGRDARAPGDVHAEETSDMKLYDFTRAPNPRRVRIYLAEKGITVPMEQVDIVTMQHKSADYTSINPSSGCRRSCPTPAPRSPNRSPSAAISRP